MCQVAINIRMVEFERRQHRGAWAIVQKFGSLIKVGTVVLIALDDEMCPLPESKGAVKVLHDSTDKHAGVIASVAQQPGDQRRGRTFAMRARDHHGMALAG